MVEISNLETIWGMRTSNTSLPWKSLSPKRPYLKYQRSTRCPKKWYHRLWTNNLRHFFQQNGKFCPHKKGKSLTLVHFWCPLWPIKWGSYFWWDSLYLNFTFLILWLSSQSQVCGIVPIAGCQEAVLSPPRPHNQTAGRDWSWNPQ